MALIDWFRRSPPQRLAAPSPRQPRANLLTDFHVERLFGALTRIPDVDAHLARLGLARRDLFRLIQTDDEIAAAVETRTDALLSTPWRLEPVGEATPALNSLWETLEPLVPEAVRQALSARWVGYAVSEVIWTETGRNRYAPVRVVDHPIEAFELDAYGRLYAKSRAGEDGALDTEHKFLLTRCQPSHQQPYGQPLLAKLYWPWFFRHNAWRFWMQFVERFADPIILGQTHDADGFLRAAEAAGLASVLALPVDGDAKVVAQSHPGEFERVDRAISHRIQKLLLGQTLTSHVERGSLAAAEVHNEVRADKRRSDIRLVTPALQTLVTAAWRLGGNSGPPPRFVMADDTGLETERAKRDEALYRAGVRFTDQYLLRVYDFEPGDFTLAAEAKPPSPASDLVAPAPPLALAAPRFTRAQMLVEQIGDAALADAPPAPLDREAIARAVRGAQSRDDLIDRLAAVLAQDPADPRFVDALERALFAAEVLGYVQQAPPAAREGARLAEAELRLAERALDLLERDP